MDRFGKAFRDLLDKAGGRLLRQKKHLIFRLPTGQNVVRSSTPSDWRRSRKSLADLRRALSSLPFAGNLRAPEAGSSENGQSVRRMTHPNRPPRGDGEVIIPNLGSIFSEKETSAILDRFPIDNLRDLTFAAQLSPAWWALDPCGRVRVLLKLAVGFSNPTAVSLQHCVLDENELKRRALRKDEPNPIHEQLFREWQGRSIPALIFDDPEEGQLLVEVTAFEKLGRKQIVVAQIEDSRKVSNRNGCHLIYLPKADAEGDAADSAGSGESSKCLFLAYGEQAISGWEPFQATPAWTDPKLIRAALREVRNNYAVAAMGSMLDGDLDPESREGRLKAMHDAIDEKLFDAACEHGEQCGLELDSTSVTVNEVYAAAHYLLQHENGKVCLRYEVKLAPEEGPDTGVSTTIDRSHVELCDGELKVYPVLSGPCCHNGEYFITDGLPAPDISSL